MHENGSETELAWADAGLAAAIFATDPNGVGGVILRTGVGSARDTWIEVFRSLLPPNAPVRKAPINITDDRLIGGLDLAATLKAGYPIAERGLMAEADGGVIVLPMAERLSAATSARLTGALDQKLVACERDGFMNCLPARFGILALDEGGVDDERPPSGLLDRLAIQLRLESLPAQGKSQAYTRADVDRARLHHVSIEVSGDLMEALCAASLALGVQSINATLLALRVARIAAALGNRNAASEADAEVAARLVLAPRATRLPMPETDPQQNETPLPPDQEQTQDAASETVTGALEDVVIAAAQAAIPADLLALLQSGAKDRARSPSSGRSGALKKSSRRGRTVGVQRGSPRTGARLNLVETLRASAPWQKTRRSARNAEPNPAHPRIEVRASDFRVKRLKQHAETATIFVVDASGSAALHRLAEAKGAVELILADCYVRRDQVALIAFSGRGTELLLPPTRSLTRAKRNLADLPGGGGTPTASAIEAATTLAEAIRRKGQTPAIVLLTDGRANIGRDGKPGRQHAEQDAVLAAQNLRAAGFSALVVDTSPRPQPQAAQIANAMGAKYLPLPYADAETLSRAVEAQHPTKGYSGKDQHAGRAR